MWVSIPGPWDHDLSPRQMVNPLSHPGFPPLQFLPTSAFRLPCLFFCVPSPDANPQTAAALGRPLRSWTQGLTWSPRPPLPS